MVEIAKLVLTGDSSGLRKANAELDKVPPKAGKAQGAVSKMAREEAKAAREAIKMANAQRKAAQSANELARAQSVAAGRAGRLRGQVQNASFQIGDFATQVGAGTAASVALGQQLPQLLGGFGALGAALGALVAIGVPLASSFLDFGDAAEKAVKQIEDLEDAVGRASKAAETAGIEVAKASTRLSEVATPVELARAVKELEEFQANLGEVAMLSPLSLVYFSDATEMLADKFDISAESADLLYTSIARIEFAEGPQKVADAIDQLIRGLIESEGGVNNLNKETLEFISSLVTVQGEAKVIQSILEQYESTLNGAAGGMAALGVEAQKAAKHAAALAATISTLGARGSGRSAGPGGPLANSTDAQFLRQLGFVPSDEAPKAQKQPRPSKARSGARRGGGGGGGGRSSAASEAQREAEAIQKVIEKLQVEIGLIGKSDQARMLSQELRRAGVDLYSEEGQQISDLVEKLTNLTYQHELIKEALQGVENAAQEAFVGFLSGAQSAQDAIRNLLQQLGNLALNQAFQMMWGGKGGGGGGIGGMLAGLFGGARAMGGPVMAGVPYLVNENTPNSEIFVPSQSGAVLNVPQAQAAVRDMGQVSQQNVTVQAPQPQVVVVDSVDRVFDELNGQRGRVTYAKLKKENG
ncbi:hypothetical protein [Halovulum sp. GXIMD14793]